MIVAFIVGAVIWIITIVIVVIMFRQFKKTGDKF